jgi:hypothetical protein
MEFSIRQLNRQCEGTVQTYMPLYVSATLVTIFREVHYQGGTHRNVTNLVCEPVKFFYCAVGAGFINTVHVNLSVEVLILVFEVAVLVFEVLVCEVLILVVGVFILVFEVFILVFVLILVYEVLILVSEVLIYPVTCQKTLSKCKTTDCLLPNPRHSPTHSLPPIPSHLILLNSHGRKITTNYFSTVLEWTLKSST